MKKCFSPILLLFTIIFSLLNVSCIYNSHHRKYKKDRLAVIAPVNGSKVEGWVRFRKIDCGEVLVKAKITGLTPNKKHGFHIHQYGDCRENGKNAGSHLNPYDHEHGSLDSEERHLGDLENLLADKNGVAFYEEVVDMCLRKVGGRSVIIHAQPDDLTSQPTGNAGPYIGCGVIGYVKPLKKKAELSQQRKEEDVSIIKVKKLDQELEEGLKTVEAPQTKGSKPQVQKTSAQSPTTKKDSDNNNKDTEGQNTAPPPAEGQNTNPPPAGQNTNPPPVSNNQGGK